MKNNDITLILVVIGIFGGIGAGVFLLTSEIVDDIKPAGFNIDGPTKSGFTKLNNTSGVYKFSSSEELRVFLMDLQLESNFIFGDYYQVPVDNFAMEESLELSQRTWDSNAGVPVPAAEPQGDLVKFQTAEDGLDYSTTNIQVKNVDEPDFIKNDGKYLYILVGNELMIVDAYPAQEASIIFESDFDIPNYHNYEDMFLNNNKLAVIYQDSMYKSIPYEFDEKRTRAVQSPITNVIVLDIEDRTSPKIINEYSIDGWYHDSRMIKENVFLVTKDHLDYNFPIIPKIQEFDNDDFLTPETYYFDGVERPSEFTTISAIGLNSDEITAETYLLGSSDTIFVSDNSIYLTFQKHYPSQRVIFEKITEEGLMDVLISPISDPSKEVVDQISKNNSITIEQKWSEISEIIEEEYQKLPESKRMEVLIKFEKEFEKVARDLQFNSLRTIVHKITINDADIVSFEYVASAEVLGHVLNQFSMDEYQGNFRIATSVQAFGWGSSSQYNNVYILDDTLNLVGSLEEIAPQERIYSARFIADKLYLVTFRQIDPFFVIDLSETKPKILGELKIPGFSNYLHPYGKDHIIGIGRDIGEDGRIGNQEGGIKIAMFDVSEFENPQLKDQIIIGKSGTWSSGLDDHKAILIDEKKNILSIPIRHDDFMEPRMVFPEETDSDEIEPSTSRLYPMYDQWNGFYVYRLDEKTGFDEIGQIRHETNEYSQRARSLYIEDVLYTVTDHLLSINDLDDLDRIKSLVLN